MRATFKWGYAGIQTTLTVLGLWTVVQLIKATEPVILHNYLLGTIKIVKNNEILIGKRDQKSLQIHWFVGKVLLCMHFGMSLKRFHGKLSISDFFGCVYIGSNHFPEYRVAVHARG